MTSIRNGKKNNKEIYFSLFFYIESFVYNKGNRNNTNEAKEIFF
jgi:cbb3-type cytochrome oxidase subunit 3